MESGKTESRPEPQKLVECPGCGRRFLGRGLVGTYCLSCGDPLVEIAEERPEPLRDEPVVEVYRTSDWYQAEMVREVLEAEGVMVAVRTSMAFGVLTFTVDGLGEVGVLALQSEADRAREIVNDYLEQISVEGSSESEEEEGQ